VQPPAPKNDAPAAAAAAQAPASVPNSAINIPIDYYKLDNGLKVVLSRDTTAPTVTVGVYYHIGFRIEPKGRTGFAHLFEHLMFQGSGNLGKMEFIRLVEGNGGVLNGSTRFDYTNYYQIVPAHVLETVLWAEADRMKALAITQANLTNQQGVVKNEVRDATMNQPYGGFPWLTMPQVANTNWYNAHNFYGDLTDLQLMIMSVLWSEREATIGTIHEQLNTQTPVARKTVAMILSRLEQRRLVSHRLDGREGVYKARVAKQNVLRSRMASLLGALFVGQPRLTGAHALDPADVRTGDVEKMAAMIRQLERDVKKED